jgi:hypothetical protein
MGKFAPGFPLKMCRQICPKRTLGFRKIQGVQRVKKALSILLLEILAAVDSSSMQEGRNRNPALRPVRKNARSSQIDSTKKR